MEGFVSGLHVNVDLTLLDRVQLLLSRQPSAQQDAGKTWSLHGGPSLDGLGRVKHSLYMTASNINTIQQVLGQHSLGGAVGELWVFLNFSKDKQCSIKLWLHPQLHAPITGSMSV